MGNISTYTAQKRLTFIWFLGTGLLLIVILIWLIGGKFPIDDVTTWIIQNVGPYTTLITTTFIVRYSQQNSQSTEIDGFFYRLSMTMSIFYFLILFLILIYIPIHEFDSPKDGVKGALEKSNKILPFIQSILGGVLGVFFVKKK